MAYDVIIIGSGPAGYVSAIRSGQVGLKTLIIEKEKIGGMCLNWGCIPSKALLESAKLFSRIKQDASRFGIDGIDKKSINFNWSKAVKRSVAIVNKLTSGVDYLLKKNGVDIIYGEAVISSKDSVTVNKRNIKAKNIIIATGSVPEKISQKTSNIPVVEIKDLYNEQKLPDNIVVLGQNSVALEISQLLFLSGKKVTLLVPGERILPLADSYLAAYMLSKFKKDKIQVHLRPDLDINDLKYENGELISGKNRFKCDMLINARNRNGIIPKNKISLELENGFIKTDDNCKTSSENVFAIGDVNGKSSFAHIGSAQGYFVINFIKGIKSKLDLRKYPMNMYTVPEVAQIGFTEDEIKQTNVEYKVSEFPLSANGKAMTEGNTEGFIRMLSDKKYGEVLGVQIIAPNATDMIAEACAFMQVESTVYDVAQTVHAHPTISEIFMEAGYEAVDKAIHK